MIRTVILTVLALVALASNAEARQKRATVAKECNVTMPCDFSYGPEVFKEARRVARGEAIAKAVGFGGVRIRAHDRLSQARSVPSYGVPSPVVRQTIERVASAATQIVSHPSGCPSRAFCGCGAAVRVFGSPVRSLWLAANWFKFPRTAPAAGMVAVRSHHVFVLEAHLGGDTWQVYDANSGGHATRIHARSIRGYAVVNPHGSKYASAE